MISDPIGDVGTLPTSFLSTLHASARLGLFLFSCVVITVILVPMLTLKLETAPVRRAYFRTMARVLGLKVIVHGKQANDRPLLIVCNHISYLDVVALGAHCDGEFIARGDLADWPVFGFLAKLGSTIFIDRRRQSTGEARDQIQDRLEHGRALIMFPESTSGDGNHPLPFKSALFTVAERVVADRAVTVQPASIAYTRMNGLPIGVGWRPYYAWYGDMTLPPHLWQVLKLGVTTIEVAFHDPVAPADFAGRKALAAHCARVSADGFSRMLSGRGSA
ncbi:MAG: 1-acyl-sn-glycerol-3-phosphate acyltransferase [Rhodobacteraceae bacterium]|nr:1-acyl-sn-glycerol-3-phosphate acyltransferase [Paracoccaceae bacterium]